MLSNGNRIKGLTVLLLPFYFLNVLNFFTYFLHVPDTIWKYFPKNLSRTLNLIWSGGGRGHSSPRFTGVFLPEIEQFLISVQEKSALSKSTTALGTFKHFRVAMVSSDTLIGSLCGISSIQTLESFDGSCLHLLVSSVFSRACIVLRSFLTSDFNSSAYSIFSDPYKNKDFSENEVKISFTFLAHLS